MEVVRLQQALNQSLLLLLLVRTRLLQPLHHQLQASKRGQVRGL
jgi:hypothetical protein